MGLNKIVAAVQMSQRGLNYYVLFFVVVVVFKVCFYSVYIMKQQMHRKSQSLIDRLILLHIVCWSGIEWSSESFMICTLCSALLLDKVHVPTV